MVDVMLYCNWQGLPLSMKTGRRRQHQTGLTAKSICVFLDFTFSQRYTLFMSLLELLLVAVGLSMDAFAVAICKGLSIQQESHPEDRILLHNPFIPGLWFGIFQGAMPLIGYFDRGSNSAHMVEQFRSLDCFCALARSLEAR
jgi:hypothetical protein